MNTGMHVSSWTKVFCRYMPKSGISGSYDSSISSVWRNFHTVLHLDIFIYSETSWWGQFSTQDILGKARLGGLEDSLLRWGSEIFHPSSKSSFCSHPVIPGLIFPVHFPWCCHMLGLHSLSLELPQQPSTCHLFPAVPPSAAWQTLRFKLCCSDCIIPGSQAHIPLLHPALLTWLTSAPFPSYTQGTHEPVRGARTSIQRRPDFGCPGESQRGVGGCEVAIGRQGESSVKTVPSTSS